MKPQQLKLEDTKKSARDYHSIGCYNVKVKGAIYSVSTGCYDYQSILSCDFNASDLKESVSLENYRNFKPPRHTAHEIRVYFNSLDALKLWIRKNVKHWQSRNTRINSHFLAALVNGDVTGLSETDCKALEEWEKAQPVGYSIEIVSNHLHDAICDIGKAWTDAAQFVTIHWRA